MSGAFCRQVSIAVWPFAWSPEVSALQTTCGAVSYFWASFGLTPDAPKPLRNPLWRRYPTDGPGKRSSIAIFAVLPENCAFAHFPIRTPAVKLFVANSALTADAGLGG